MTTGGGHINGNSMYILFRMRKGRSQMARGDGRPPFSHSKENIDGIPINMATSPCNLLPPFSHSKENINGIPLYMAASLASCYLALLIVKRI